MKKGILIFFLAFCGSLRAEDGVKVYPTNWWAGMKDPSLQLMIRGMHWEHAPSVTVNYPGVQLLKVQPAENPHYLFLDLRISPQTKPGMMKIRVKPANGTELVIDYPLLAR